MKKLFDAKFCQKLFGVMQNAALRLAWFLEDDLASIRAWYEAEREKVSFAEFMATPVVAAPFEYPGNCRRAKFYRKNRDVVSVSLVLRCEKIVRWMLDTSWSLGEAADALVSHRVCHKLVEICAVCGVSSNDTQLEEEVCEFYNELKHHAGIRKCLCVEDEEGFLAVEYAVIREQYSLALAFFNTEGAQCREIEGVHPPGYRMLEYDISRYTREVFSE